MAHSDNQAEILLTEARLESPPALAMLKYYDLPALLHEKGHFSEFNAVDLAHTVMLAERGIITQDAARSILAGLLELRANGPDAFPVDERKGSFLLQVEAYLFARMGEDVGGQMHTGRSRIDQGATVRRLYERNRILDVLGQLNGFRAAVIALAEKHQFTIMAGYTHMQQAQPWVFGHYLLSIATRLTDDFNRLVETYARVNLNPLGAVGLSGSSWPLDRNRTTELLGFGGVVENSKLAREGFHSAESAAALSFLMATLNDLATDLHIWSSTEFGFVESADAYCGTSSIFPQKKNPAGLEAIKKAAGGSVTWLASALATFRAEGTGDQAMRDLPFIDDALQTTQGMLDLFTGIIETLIVHEDRMRQSLAESWCTSSNLADVIVQRAGLSFRQAHHVVARLVRICLAGSIPPASVTANLLDTAAQQTIGMNVRLTDADIQNALDPLAFVQTRTTAGSVSPREIGRMLSVARTQLKDGLDWFGAERNRLGDCNARLEAAISRVLAP